MKAFALLAALLSASALFAPCYAAQSVVPAAASITTTAGKTIQYQPVYSVTSPETGAETGFAVRVHFNSKALQLNAVGGVFAYGMQPVSAVMPDTSDFDADPTTDSYFIAAWVDFTAQWPGADMLPLNLLSASFQPVAGFTGNTVIRSSAAATADNATFQSTPMQVTVGSGLALQVRGLLQGAYQSSTQLMRDDLRKANLLPLTQPYANLGYKGTETLAPGLLALADSTAPTDWVLVELRDKNAPNTVLATMAAVVQRDGDVADPNTNATDLMVPNLPAGDYYVALRHRNHLGVMTAQPVSLSATPTLVDFTASTLATYGQDARASSGTQMLLRAGDANNDNKLIDDGAGNDKNTVIGAVLGAPDNTAANSNFRLPGYFPSDLNLDGYSVFSGPGNDLDTLLGNVLLSPSNTTTSTNYILRGTLPK